MREREEVIAFCMTLPGAVEDYPFHDRNWTVMRHGVGGKMFASICHHLGNIWVNVKCVPETGQLFRSAYKSVVPAFHMNKEHWSSIILDGGVPDDVVKLMIRDSYGLTEKKKNRRGNS